MLPPDVVLLLYLGSAARKPFPGLARTQKLVKPLVYEKMHRFFSRDLRKVFAIVGVERP
jgi:hypothetical protein